MKTVLAFLTAVLFFGQITTSTQARDAVSVDFFYDNLEPYGNWREVGGYGYCWQPRDVGPDWRPYADGRWVYTDAGWTWDSSEPFGWAVYHYGRWVDIGRVGWVWVPGTEWGPGWVSWRHSSQHTGWAPLPPEARLLLAIGLNSWVDDYYDIGPSQYRFVENQNFGAQRLNTVFVDQRQNVSIINQTTNITNISYINNAVYNGGPGFDKQLRQSREPIQRYKLDRRQDFDGDSRRRSPEYLRSHIAGNSMSVLALPFTGRASAAPHQLGEKVERAEVNHGWRNAGSPDEIAAIRLKMKGKEKAPSKQPPADSFSKITDEAAVREERHGDKRDKPPAERPSNSKGKAEDKADRKDMPPSLPKGQNRPKDRPMTPSDEPKGKGAERPSRPSERPNPPLDQSKGKGVRPTFRPDLPPGFQERQMRPGEPQRNSTEPPKGKQVQKPERQNAPGDRPPTPDDEPRGTKPTVRPLAPAATAEQPNRGGRNKIEAPQLPRNKTTAPRIAIPNRSAPQIAPPKPRLSPERPRIAEPKALAPAARPPQAIKPTSKPEAPRAAIAPPKGQEPRSKGSKGDTRKKDD